MAIKGVSIIVSFIAWDTENNTGKTGDSGNFTLRLIKDGTSAAPTNSASEVDATNAPGIYKITVTAGEMDYSTVTLAGKSSTSGVVIIPVQIITEQGQFDALPTATENADALLKRDWTSVSSEASRSVLNALRFLRNKWTLSGATLSVKKEDDSTEAWSAAVTTTEGADPITGSDPS